MASLREFIRNNRAELDQAIRQRLGRPDFRLNDQDRAQWIANDERLYNWARREGVRNP